MNELLILSVPLLVLEYVTMFFEILLSSILDTTTFTLLPTKISTLMLPETKEINFEDFQQFSSIDYSLVKDSRIFAR